MIPLPSLIGEMPKVTLGLYKEAIADYDRAIEIGPADARSYYNRGIAYKNLGLYEEVIVIAQQGYRTQVRFFQCQ